MKGKNGKRRKKPMSNIEEKGGKAEEDFQVKRPSKNQETISNCNRIKEKKKQMKK